MRSVRPWCRALAALAGLASVFVGLVQAGRQGLDGPPLDTGGALDRWYEAVGPEVAVMSLVRLVALALTGWLLLAAALQVATALPALEPMRALADLISPRSLQRLGRSLAGLSLTATLAASAPGAGIAAAGSLAAIPAAAELAPVGSDPPLPPAPPAVPAWPATPAGATGTATMHLLPAPPRADGEPLDINPPSTPEAAELDSVTVAPGDSLWSIAADELAQDSARPPSDREIAGYWQLLIAANRARLVDPANPDLIYPGQLLQLPAR